MIKVGDQVMATSAMQLKEVLPGTHGVVRAYDADKTWPYLVDFDPRPINCPVDGAEIVLIGCPW